MRGLSDALRDAANEAVTLESNIEELKLSMDKQKRATEKLIETLMSAIANYNEAIK